MFLLEHNLCYDYLLHTMRQDYHQMQKFLQSNVLLVHEHILIHVEEVQFRLDEGSLLDLDHRCQNQNDSVPLL